MRPEDEDTDPGFKAPRVKSHASLKIELDANDEEEAPPRPRSNPSLRALEEEEEGRFKPKSNSEIKTPVARPRTTGRREMDHIHQKGWWVLVIGVLMQGGFMTMAWKLMSTNAEQVKDEREASQKQSDAYRLQLAVQHRELVDVVRELAISNKEVAKASHEGLEELHKGQDEIEKMKRSLELERAKLLKKGK
jgi:hypothetical protein